MRMKTKTPGETPIGDVSRIQVGYMDRVLGEISVGDDGLPEFSGDTEALRALLRSVAHQPLYAGLTLPQTLALMTQRLRGPTWAKEVKPVINLDEDPHNANWLRILAQRRADEAAKKKEQGK